MRAVNKRRTPRRNSFAGQWCAGGYGQGEEGEREAPADADQIFQKLQKWCKLDFNSNGQVKWRTDAREDFDFEAGRQFTEDDKAILADAKRPIVIFNRVGVTIDAVTGRRSVIGRKRPICRARKAR